MLMTGAAASSGSRPLAANRRRRRFAAQCRRRRPRDADARAGRAAHGGRGVRASVRFGLAAEPQAQAKLRSGRHIEFRPHVRGRVRISVQTQFSAGSPRRSPHPRIGRHFALMRALRPLHRDLPNLCDAGRRARQSARAHLPDQGSARDRPQHHGRGCLADRPLPQLPLLHDDMSIGRRLSPARRSCAGSDRRNLPPSVH